MWSPVGLRAFSDTVIGERSQQGRHGVARPFLDQDFRSFVGAAQSEVGVDAVGRRFLDLFDMSRERSLAASVILVADDHSICERDRVLEFSLRLLLDCSSDSLHSFPRRSTGDILTGRLGISADCQTALRNHWVQL